jgi:hypothetical protein
MDPPPLEPLDDPLLDPLDPPLLDPELLDDPLEPPEEPELLDALPASAPAPLEPPLPPPELPPPLVLSVDDDPLQPAASAIPITPRPRRLRMASKLSARRRSAQRRAWRETLEIPGDVRNFPADRAGHWHGPQRIAWPQPSPATWQPRPAGHEEHEVLPMSSQVRGAHVPPVPHS